MTRTALTADVTATFYDYGVVLFTMNSREAAQTWGDQIGYGMVDETPQYGSSYMTEARFGEALIARAKAAGLTVVRQEIADSYRLVSEVMA